jgi:hypothetical protein
LEENMTEAHALPLTKRRQRQLVDIAAGPAVPWEFDGVEAVEISTPDEYCAGLLVQQAAPLFTATIVSGSGWIVRFEEPPSGGNWVVDLLALVERWLTSVPLPCARASRGGRSYLIRDPATGQPATGEAT